MQSPSSAHTLSAGVGGAGGRAGGEGRLCTMNVVVA